MPSKSASITVRSARVFTSGAVLVVCGYGLLLLIPVLISMMVVSVLKFGIWTFLLPLLMICAATYLLPFGFGNTHITRLARSMPAPDADPRHAFIVQVTLSPRLRSGLRALIEDADDIGWLSVTESDLVFHGDSIDLSLPWGQIRELRVQTIGLRGLYLYPRLALVVSGLPEVNELRFSERSSWLLPASRRSTRRLYDCLSTKVQTGRTLSETAR